MHRSHQTGWTRVPYESETASEERRWYLLRMSSDCFYSEFICITALATVLDEMGIIPQDATAVCFASSCPPFPGEEELPGRRVDDIVDPDSGYYPRILPTPETLAYTAGIPEGMRLAAVALRTVIDTGAYDYNDFECGVLDTAEIKKALAELSDVAASYSLGRLELDVGDALHMLGYYDKMSILFYAAVELPLIEGEKDSAFAQSWEVADQCQEAWSTMMHRAFGSWDYQQHLPESIISALEGYGLLDGFLDKACGEYVPEEQLAKALFCAIREGVSLDEALAKQEGERTPRKLMRVEAIGNRAALDAECPVPGDAAWGKFEELLEHGWVGMERPGVKVVCAEVDGGILARPRSWAGNVREVARLLPEDGWSVIVDNAKYPAMPHSRPVSLLSCLSLSGRIPEGFGRCVCLGREFYQTHLAGIEEQVEAGRAVVLLAETDSPESAGLAGIARISETVGTWFLESADDISPEKLDALSGVIGNAELDGLMGDSGLFSRWPAEAVELLSFGKSRDSRLSYRFPYEDGQFYPASIDQLSALGLIQHRRARDAVNELAGLQKIWHWVMEKAGLGLPAAASSGCWELIRDIGLRFGADSIIDAYYSGIQAEDLVAS